MSKIQIDGETVAEVPSNLAEGLKDFFSDADAWLKDLHIECDPVPVNFYNTVGSYEKVSGEATLRIDWVKKVGY